jgi:hypothetical protein
MLAYDNGNGRELFVSLKKRGSPRTGLSRPTFENMQAEAKVILETLVKATL